MCGSTVIFRSSDVRAIWCQIFETAQGTRLDKSLPPLSYPATTAPLINMFNKLGLTHRAVQFLLKHLPKNFPSKKKMMMTFLLFPEKTMIVIYLMSQVVQGQKDMVEENHLTCLGG